MIFSVKFTSEDGESIEIGKAGVEEEMNLITEVEVFMDTVNNDARNKANATLAKIKIVGAVDKRISEELLNIFNWSKELDEKKWYRTIEIKVKSSMNEVFRTYIIPKVFVVDYLESYKTEMEGNNEADQFKLYLTQKENNFKTIEAF